MRIDSHQHFWRYDPTRHDWITDDMASIRRDFLPEDLEPLLRSSGFDGCVAVQADQSEEETRFLLGLAETHDFIRGVVGWVNLLDAAVEERLASVAQHDRLCGLRHIVQSEPDDRFLLREEFMRGVGLLSAYGLTYDILIYPRHLTVAEAFVRHFPNQKFVVDHLAKPRIKDQKFRTWARGIEALAQHPNVSCKLSGMVTEADWKNWRKTDFAVYLDAALEAFGPGRVMIGSDWPVCLVSADYATVMSLVTEYISEYSPDEQAMILGGSASVFYGL